MGRDGATSRRSLLSACGLLASAGVAGHALSPATGQSTVETEAAGESIGLVVYNADDTHHEVRVRVGDARDETLTDREVVSPADATHYPDAIAVTDEPREYAVTVGLVDGPSASTTVAVDPLRSIRELHGEIRDGRVRLSAVSAR